MRIHLVTPARARSTKGNRITADRWGGFLEELGHNVAIKTDWKGERCDLMIALHAKRSAQAIRRCARMMPHVPIVLTLTGTDLYANIRQSKIAQQSLDLSHRIVLLQELGLRELSAKHQKKCRIIYQSTDPFHNRPSPLKRFFEVTVIGHLRDVKDPFRAAIASRAMSESSRIRVSHIGEALSQQMSMRAKREMQTNPRYHWFGPLSRARTLSLLTRSRVLVHSSRLEGGANIVSESIVNSVPVISSKISGSIGLLGEDYSGYFPVGDTAALVELLERVENDASFLRLLGKQLNSRKPLFAPQRELQSWRSLLDELDVRNSS